MNSRGNPNQLTAVAAERASAREQRRSVALRAALAVAERYDLRNCQPTVLRDSTHVTMRLAPYPLVARACMVREVSALRLAHELAVARHLASAGAAIVPPSDVPPPGPHEYDSMRLTLWKFVDHDPAGVVDEASLIAALKDLHAKLSDYDAELPPFTDAIAECARLLEDATAMPAMPASDRSFLIAEHARLVGRLRSYRFNSVPLHGDCHLGNLLVTTTGPLWTDFESACRGPVEWDLTSLPESVAAAFPDIHADLLSVLRDLRSLCVAAWCWDDLNPRPEVREAATYHLERLRKRAALPTVK